MTARILYGDEQTLYRAVIVTTVPATPEHDYWGQHFPAKPERVTTSYAGPFKSKNAASGAIGRSRHNKQYENGWRGRAGMSGEITVTGHVEETTLAWKPVTK